MHCNHPIDCFSLKVKSPLFNNPSCSRNFSANYAISSQNFITYVVQTAQKALIISVVKGNSSND
jgi:hypothetical protein